MAEKMKGFGTVKSGGAMSGFKTVGKMLTRSGVRPVGGNDKGVTSGGKPAAGEAKMGTMGGKGVCCGGKGPTTMPKVTHGVVLKTMGAMGKSGIGSKGVRAQPE